MRDAPWPPECKGEGPAGCVLEKYLLRVVSGPHSQSDDWVNTGLDHYSTISIPPFFYERCC